MDLALSTCLVYVLYCACYFDVIRNVFVRPSVCTCCAVQYLDRIDHSLKQISLN
jgi:hypothetical protein